MIATDKRKAIFLLHQEGMSILGIGMTDVSSNVTDLFSIRPRGAHPLLRFAHFRSGHHLHGFGDLARVLHAFDLDADFLSSRHMNSRQSALRLSKSLSSSIPR